MFETVKQPPSPSWKVFWVAVVMAFLVAHFSPKRISPIALSLLQVVPQTWLVEVFHDQDAMTIVDRVILPSIVSMKKLCFFVSLLIIGYPVMVALRHSAHFWKRLRLKRLIMSTAALFLILSALNVPYGNSHGLPFAKSGLSGLGYWFGEMSLSPFSFDLDVYSGRLLKPALAHYLHLSGYARYYLFSLACTFLLVFLTLVFLESKIACQPLGDQRKGLQGPGRWIAYLSVMTSSFIMVSFQGPGKVDDLAFIFILLMAWVPLTSQARLGLLALTVLTHESITLALVPAIIFWFPKDDKMKALLIIGLFFFIGILSYGFNVSQGLAGHGAVLQEGSVWRVAMSHPLYVLAAVGFTYKLWWMVFFWMVWLLWTRDHIADARALFIATCFPILLCLVGWDTTRIAGFGFLGMLLAMVLIAKEGVNLSKMQVSLLSAVVAFNIFIPSYQIILYPPVGQGPPVYMNTHATYPYWGVYNNIHALIQPWLFS